MIPSSDEDLLLLVKFILERFHGSLPEEKQLLNAIADWRRSMK